MLTEFKGNIESVQYQMIILTSFSKLSLEVFFQKKKNTKDTEYLKKKKTNHLDLIKMLRLLYQTTIESIIFKYT